jgi:hypothetical protein
LPEIYALFYVLFVALSLQQTYGLPTSYLQWFTYNDAVADMNPLKYHKPQHLARTIGGNMWDSSKGSSGIG